MNSAGNLGTPATSKKWDKMEARLAHTPEAFTTTNRFLTLNNYGFSDFSLSISEDNWLIQTVLECSKQARKPILDIGGGYGSLTKKMLGRGAQVILNDMDERHLIVARKNIEDIYYEKLFIMSGKFADDLELPIGSLAAVTLIRVLLFLSPDEIEQGFLKIRNWLMPGGKIFIFVPPPQRQEYGEQTLKIYGQQWEAGNPWPGYGFKCKDILTPKKQKHFPTTIHLMDERPLKKLLLKLGFTIERYGFFEDNSATSKYQEFGLIAHKDNL